MQCLDDSCFCVCCCFCCIIVYVDVTLYLKASNGGASVVVAGRLFHSRAARFAFCRTCTARLRAAFEVTTPIEDWLACYGYLMSVCIDGIQNWPLGAHR